MDDGNNGEGPHGTSKMSEINQLMGEIIEDPETQKKDIESLLFGFLRAMTQESQPEQTPQEPQEDGQKI